MNQTRYYYWLADCSGSMAINNSISQLNQTLEAGVRYLKKNATQSHHLPISMNIIKIANEATWHIHEKAPDQINWSNLKAGGYTSTGQALQMVLNDLEEKQPQYPPQIYLLSDGMPTDMEIYEETLAKLKQKNTEMACIAFGEADRDILSHFGNENSSIFIDNINQLKDKFFELLHKSVDTEVLSKQENTNSQESTETKEASPADPSQEIARLLSFFNNKELEALKDSAYSPIKVGLKNPREFINKKPPVFSKKPTQNPFLVCQLKSDQLYYAFINPRVTWTKDFIEKWGLKAWFNLEPQYEPLERYIIETQFPAKVELKEDNWELTEKGSGLLHKKS